jgi:POT family proton-dependent oligopeptide transporter
MTKLSPKPLQGMMMGLWFLASAYGQYLAGILGAGLSKGNAHATNYENLLDFTTGYRHFAIYAIIAGVVMLAISPLIRKLMQEVK